MKTPNHLENPTKVIEAGKDLFIKWPAGRGLKETKLLAELAKEKGIWSLVGLQARQKCSVSQGEENWSREGRLEMFCPRAWCVDLRYLI